MVDRVYKTLTGEQLIPGDKDIGVLNDIQGKQKRAVLYCNIGDEHKPSEMPPFLRKTQSNEIWANETTAQEVQNKISEELNSLISQGPKPEFIYASLNTTPDTKSIMKGVLAQDDVLQQGRRMQEYLPKVLEELRQNLCSVTLDGPSRKSVQNIVNANKQSSR